MIIQIDVTDWNSNEVSHLHGFEKSIRQDIRLDPAENSYHPDEWKKECSLLRDTGNEAIEVINHLIGAGYLEKRIGNPIISNLTVQNVKSYKSHPGLRVQRKRPTLFGYTVTELDNLAGTNVASGEIGGHQFIKAIARGGYLPSGIGEKTRDALADGIEKMEAHIKRIQDNAEKVMGMKWKEREDEGPNPVISP